MRYLKPFNLINESYFQDLTPYVYDGRNSSCLNIGWLDGREYNMGECPKEFIDNLDTVISSNQFVSARHKGFYTCDLCDKSIHHREKGKSSTILTINDDGRCYSFPKMILHYIKSHNYKPPQEFIDAVMSLEIKELKDSNVYSPNGFRGRRRYK